MEYSSLKKDARKHLKKHYLFFMFVCLFAAFISSEFSSSLSITNLSENIPILDKVDEHIIKIDYDSLTQIMVIPHKNIKKLNEKFVVKIFEKKIDLLNLLSKNINTNNIFVLIVQGVLSIFSTFNIATDIFIILSLIISFVFWFYVTNVFKVNSRRIFLEGRKYEKITPKRFIFLYQIKKWNKTAWTMFVVTIYQLLWSLTIVGGFIKRYSYYLVPYILAENPNIKTKDAINLSRAMMNNHKLECFYLELSFIGWIILNIVTLGIAGIFYYNPYKIATMTEFYVNLRAKAKSLKISNSELLNDKYLYEKASDEVLAKEYADIHELKKQIKPTPKIKGIRGFISDFFGIKTASKEVEDEYAKQQVLIAKVKACKNILARKRYPDRLFSIPPKKRRSYLENLNYLKHYSVISIILIFFALSFTGWIWEVSLHLIRRGVFVNRGVLHGPWLPIYGGGSILILIALNKLRKHPVVQFITTFILCGFVEYFTSCFLEAVYNIKWWDYSNYFLNLNGRIYAGGLLFFAIGGFAVVYFIAPLLDNFIEKINKKVAIPLIILLLFVYISDHIYSTYYPNTGKGISTNKQIVEKV